MREDRATPDVHRLIEPSLGGRARVMGEERLRIIDFIRDLAASELGGYLEVLAIHAEGSLEAQKLAVLMDCDLDSAKQTVARIAGVVTAKPPASS